MSARVSIYNADGSLLSDSIEYGLPQGQMFGTTRFCSMDAYCPDNGDGQPRKRYPLLVLKWDSYSRQGVYSTPPWGGRIEIEAIPETGDRGV